MSNPNCPDCGLSTAVVHHADHVCADSHRGAFVCSECHVAFDREDSEPCSGGRRCWHEPMCESVCRVCRGSGADPMSDNVNWLPCGTCDGKGIRR